MGRKENLLDSIVEPELLVGIMEGNEGNGEMEQVVEITGGGDKKEDEMDLFVDIIGRSGEEEDEIELVSIIGGCSEDAGDDVGHE